MLVLLFILIVFVILISALSLKLIALTKNNSMPETISFLKKFLFIIGIVLSISYLISLIVSLINIAENEYIFILLIRMIIEVIYFVSIFILGKRLLDNLENKIIFADENVVMIKQIGNNFIRLSLIQIVLGLVIGIIRVLVDSPFKEFRLEFNPVIILYLIIGAILLIISFIMQGAVKIYKENELTI